MTAETSSSIKIPQTITLLIHEEVYRFQVTKDNLGHGFLGLLPIPIDLYVGEQSHFWGYLPYSLQIEKPRPLTGTPVKGMYYVPALQTITVYFQDSSIAAPNDLYMLGQPLTQLDHMSEYLDDILISGTIQIEQGE